MAEAGFFEIVAIAFGLQLAVLPGEKVQFIIAGLSTRFDPKIVVAAAGTAFAGWTALEILAGEALQRALPGEALGLLTAGMFLLFAYLLWRTIPEASPDGVPDAEEAMAEEGVAETDGGTIDEGLDVQVPVVGWTVPNALGGFLPIFVMMAVGEFGDKTQIVTIGLATDYGATPAIWVGEMLAIVPVSLANAYFFNRFADRVDFRKLHVGSALLFVFFGLDTLSALLFGFSVWEHVVTAAARAGELLATVV